jgi:hypothetical protein
LIHHTFHQHKLQLPSSLSYRPSCIVSFSSVCIAAKVAMLCKHSTDAQSFCAGLCQVYEEGFTTSLSAINFRYKLRIHCVDNKWKKNTEASIQSWKSNILELDQLEDKQVDDSTNHLGLTATLSTKAHMARVAPKKKITEMSIMKMNHCTASTMPWEGFCNIILAHDKLQNHSNANSTTKFHANVHEQGRSTRCSSSHSCGFGQSQSWQWFNCYLMAMIQLLLAQILSSLQVLERTWFWALIWSSQQEIGWN